VNTRILVPGVLVIGLIGAFGLDRLNSYQAKPVHESFINTYFKEPPPSLREMALDVDLVVRARVVGSGLEQRDLRGTPRPITLYSFKVEEVIQAFGTTHVPDELGVLREGGSFDRGPHIDRVVQADFPQFQRGREYVLFLKWNPTDNAWIPAWGPHGVFEINGERINAVGASKIARAQSGSSVEDFVSRLRSLK
jgi:hypothetical protein